MWKRKREVYTDTDKFIDWAHMSSDAELAVTFKASLTPEQMALIESGQLEDEHLTSEQVIINAEMQYRINTEGLLGSGNE